MRNGNAARLGVMPELDVAALLRHLPPSGCLKRGYHLPACHLVYRYTLKRQGQGRALIGSNEQTLAQGNKTPRRDCRLLARKRRRSCCDLSLKIIAQGLSREGAPT